ncbi:MAG: exosortase/archaeosortase family protein [Pseudanabaena sp. CRU_2_10]|nr:exosortase/archaeosortase family protein [Pseudanabaena sp. CRU_2_10]
MTRQAVMEAVEKLNYRVTVGDVATQSGLSLATASNELMRLATDSGGHLQVAESGDIAYVFARNFRNILLNRSFKLQLQVWLKSIWKWVFYLIRISFGIVLIISIAIVVLGIIAALLALQSSSSDDNRGGSSRDRSDNRGGGGLIFMPDLWWGNPFSVFDPSYDERRRSERLASEPEQMGFLESIFSFLFGDGDPNADLEERRWRAIAQVIRQNGGVVAAEQITPYLDDIGSTSEGYEDYILPVLMKFNGQPQVSEQGAIVYSFAELQTVGAERKQRSVANHLEEKLWQFSQAGAGRVTLSAGLGIFYLVASLWLGSLLSAPALAGKLSGFLGFVSGAYWFLLGYAVLFLTVPLVRYFVLQIFNAKVASKNQQRISRAQSLQKPNTTLKQKLGFARQLATGQKVISADDLAYSTETDLTDQEYAKMLKEMDAEREN